MKTRVFALVAVFLFVSVSALAQQVQPQASGATVGSSACRESYRWDSFGAGFGSSYLGALLRPRMIDSLCFMLGRREGRAMREGRPTVFGRPSSNCEPEFHDGISQGYRLGARETGTPCYLAGYNAGKSALIISVREGRASEAVPECLPQYERGYEHGLRRVGESRPAGRVEGECYRAGYFDGTWFQIELREMRAAH